MELKYKTGIERFYERYPNYPRIEEREEEVLGIGAMMIPLRMAEEEYSQKSHNR